MKFKISLVLGFVLLTGVTIAQEEGAQGFSLQECIEYAINHNQQVMNANLDREIADAKVRETVADGLPQINGNLDLGYNYKVPTTQLPAILIPEQFRDPSIPPDGFVPVNFSTKYTGSASVNLEQMIFNGSYFVGLRAAKTYTELARKDHIKTKIDVIEAVSKAYYTVLVNKERVELINKNYNRLDSLLSDTKVMYENGFAEKIDVSRIQVQFNNLQVEKQNIERVIELSIALLKFQMGMPQTEEVVLAEGIEDIDFQSVESSLGEGFQYSDRIEYSQMQTNKDLVELDIKNTKVQYLPRIDLYGALGATAGTQSSSELLSFNKDPWFGQGIVGVRMSVPIFDGFRKSNMIQQKRIQARQIDNSFEQLKNSIDLDIKQSAISYEKAFDNMVAQSENMKLAEEVYNVTKIKYQEGVGANIEVINADADYKEAQTNYYNALYDALVAKVELEKAYGELLKN